MFEHGYRVSLGYRISLIPVARLFLLAGKIVWQGCWRRSDRFIGMRRRISPCQ